MVRKNIVKKCFLLIAAGILSATVAMTALAATKERLDTVSDPYWDEDKISIGRWDEVEHAYQYEVYLYCNESRVSTFKTKNTYTNMKTGMKKEGDYYFRVRAIPKSNSKSYTSGNWSEESDSIYLDADRVEFVQSGGVVDTATKGPGAQNTEGNMAVLKVPAASVVGQEGWIQEEAGRWYRYADGRYPIKGWWQQPNTTNWFFFNEGGYIVTGWIQPQTDGPKYYCQAPDGIMVTGDATIDGVLYHFDGSGALIQ